MYGKKLHHISWLRDQIEQFEDNLIKMDEVQESIKTVHELLDHIDTVEKEKLITGYGRD